MGNSLAEGLAGYTDRIHQSHLTQNHGVDMFLGRYDLSVRQDAPDLKSSPDIGCREFRRLSLCMKPVEQLTGCLHRMEQANHLQPG